MGETEYFGMTFKELARSPRQIKATVAYGKTRETWKGSLTIDKPKGSYKYKPELLIHLYTHEFPKIDTRAYNNGWPRIEIAVPYDDLVKMLKQFEQNLERGCDVHG